jgi:hypothetical protein
MSNIREVLDTVQYSDSSKTSFTNSNSNTVSPNDLLNDISDLVINTDYAPWYLKYYKKLGTKRFYELATKARYSDTPGVLFKWMLQNNGVVK